MTFFELKHTVVEFVAPITVLFLMYAAMLVLRRLKFFQFLRNMSHSALLIIIALFLLVTRLVNSLLESAETVSGFDAESQAIEAVESSLTLYTPIFISLIVVSLLVYFCLVYAAVLVSRRLAEKYLRFPRNVSKQTIIATIALVILLAFFIEPIAYEVTWLAASVTIDKFRPPRTPVMEPW